ncbi:MAG TPA: LacI family DNA-binding transcriptional regulator [Methylomirabilota bacterium]|nr:LacI family DNA-binding transcriptional regulator [Methylomirabilota bacterium]
MPKGSATIYQVARHAGVSIATVSRVQRGNGPVADNTRAKVARSIKALDYRPSPNARSLAASRHEASGIVFPNLSGPYYSEVIYGFERETVEARQSVLILGTHGRDGAEDLVHDLAASVDGLVIMGRTVPDRLVAELGRMKVPVVLLARPAVGEADTVLAENRSSAVELVRHMFGHGLDDLLFVGDPDASPDAAERWAGFLDAHRLTGRPQPAPPLVSDFTEGGGHDAVRTRLSAGLDDQGLPDGLVCANDEIALGALRAARELEIEVPRELAITGWDDIPVAALVSPALTTVRQPMRELGSTAAVLLAERISAGRREPRHVLLPTSLVLRASCGCQAIGGEIS